MCNNVIYNVTSRPLFYTMHRIQPKCNGTMHARRTSIVLFVTRKTTHTPLHPNVRLLTCPISLYIRIWLIWTWFFCKYWILNSSWKLQSRLLLPLAMLQEGNKLNRFAGLDWNCELALPLIWPLSNALWELGGLIKKKHFGLVSRPSNLLGLLNFEWGKWQTIVGTRVL
jgi:hypothetical protein